VTRTSMARSRIRGLRFCYEAGPLVAELGDISRFSNPRSSWPIVWRPVGGAQLLTWPARQHDAHLMRRQRRPMRWQVGVVACAL
jgi:hypothetical protein